MGEILADQGMIGNRRKIQACIDNAKAFEELLTDPRSKGSFKTYVGSFNPRNSSDALAALGKDLRKRFSYLSKITVYHFLTDIGMPVLKPDRVVRRIFHRLSVINDTNPTEKNLLETVRQGVKFSDATGLPIRYIDAVFVLYGQVRGGSAQGVCLEDRPLCKVCEVTSLCRYFNSGRASDVPRSDVEGV